MVNQYLPVYYKKILSKTKSQALSGSSTLALKTLSRVDLFHTTGIFRYIVFLWSFSCVWYNTVLYHYKLKVPALSVHSFLLLSLMIKTNLILAKFRSKNCLHDEYLYIQDLASLWGTSNFPFSWFLHNSVVVHHRHFMRSVSLLPIDLDKCLN